MNDKELSKYLSLVLRHHYSPVILTVRARDAWRSGVVFHVPEPRLYISGPIPPEFVELAGTQGAIS